MLLLNGDAFGEVARFVHVASEGDGDVVSEELEGDDGEDGCKKFEGFGDEDRVVHDFLDFMIAFCGHGDDWAFSGFDFLDVAEVFFADGIVWDDED